MSTSPRISTAPLDLPVPGRPAYLLACDKKLVDPSTGEATPLGRRSLWLRDLDKFLPPHDVKTYDELIESLRAEVGIGVALLGIRIRQEVQQGTITNYEENS